MSSIAFSEQARKATFYRRYGKRILDLLLVIPVAIIFLPVMLVVALLVRWRLGSPVLFCSPRGGRDGKEFVLYKFRTMLDVTDANGEPLHDEDRLTSFGKLLRGTSLDELPQLYNVLRGDISLIGPRPLHAYYWERYDAFQRRRVEVASGISGWAQVNGRNAISWNRKFELDVYYVDNLSFWLDLKICLLSVKCIFARKDVIAEGHATMPTFMGNSDKPEETQKSFGKAA